MPETWRASLAEVRRRATHPPLVTASVIAAVLFTALRYGTLQHDLALDIAFRYGFSGRALSMGHWSTLFTSQFLSRDAFMAISIALSLVLMLGLYEAIAGSVRALAVTAVSAAAGPLLVAGGLGLGSMLGNAFAGRTLSTLDYGTSAVTAGAGGALVAVLGMRRVRVVAVIWVLGGLLLHHQLADWEHLGSFAVGLGLGYLMGAPTRASSRQESSRSAGSVAAHGVSVLRRRVLGVSGIAVGVIAGASIASAAVPAPAMIVSVVAAPARGAAAVATSARRAAVVAAPVALTPPSVVEVTYPAPSLGGHRSAFVVLPPGYGQFRRRYPVVELLHGYPGAPGDIINGLDPVGAELLPGMPPFIAVAPDGRGPAVEDSWFADTARQRVGTAVSSDLRAYIDRAYRTNGHWSVGGLSAGGYGAAYLGARTPGAYDAVCSLSGEFIPRSPAFAGEGLQALVAASPISHTSPNGPRTLLIAGRSDSTSLRQTKAYAAQLRLAGQPHKVIVARGGHDWRLWKHELPACLRYMLGPALPLNVGSSTRTVLH